MTIRTLSTREKWLAVFVGGAFALFIVFVLLEGFQREKTRLQAEIASRTKQLALMRNLTGEFADSERRDAWVRATQPRLTNPDGAGAQLLDEVKQLAQRHEVLLEKFAIKPPERHPEFVSVAVEVESKSDWGPLVRFQHDLQNPPQFIAVESINLKIDAADPTKMRGRFKIARWYSPH